MTTTRKSPHKPYHHGNLRAALIEAGLAALEKTDTADLSLRAIARDLDVSANAAYRHFADKDALLGALAAEGFRRFAASQTQAGARASDPMQVRAAQGQAYVRFARQNPALFRLMFSHFGGMSKAGNEELRTAASAAFHDLVASAAHEAGTSIDDPRAMMLALARWSLVHGLSHLLLDGQLDIFGEHLDEVIQGVLTMSQPERATTAPSNRRTPDKGHQLP